MNILNNKENEMKKNNQNNVKAVFVLFGTRDQRNLHLKSLAAIAQIIRNKNFVNDWLAAKSTESLRDIVLLGERFHCKKEEI